MPTALSSLVEVLWLSADGASLWGATVTPRVAVLLSAPSGSVTLKDTVRVAVDGVLLVFEKVIERSAVW